MARPFFRVGDPCYIEEAEQGLPKEGRVVCIDRRNAHGHTIVALLHAIGKPDEEDIYAFRADGSRVLEAPGSKFRLTLGIYKQKKGKAQ